MGMKGGVIVNSVFLTSRSLTYAQRMDKILKKSGVPSRIDRPDLQIMDKGCAYAVVVSEGFFAEAIEVLKNNGMPPVKAVVYGENDRYRVIDI